jgi:fatty acid desaturase
MQFGYKRATIRICTLSASTSMLLLGEALRIQAGHFNEHHEHHEQFKLIIEADV